MLVVTERLLTRMREQVDLGLSRCLGRYMVYQWVVALVLPRKSMWGSWIATML